MSENRNPIDNSDQPPEVDIYGSRSKQLPPAVAAAKRVRDFVSWFGDGEVFITNGDEHPPLYARDLEAVARHVLEPLP